MPKPQIGDMEEFCCPPYRKASPVTLHRYRLPGIFWRDHYDRCGDHPGERVVVRDDGWRAGGPVVVELDDEALADLLSDAEYYSEGVDFAGEKAAYRALISSARATVRAIQRQRP